jgi:uncharacterized tellurite resistance protein B-like protein
MNLPDLTSAQKLALLDLLLLAMYSDGHLAAAEDERVQRLLTDMGYDSEHTRHQAYDEAIGRITRPAQNVSSARALATQLARAFTTPEHRRGVYDLLCDLVTSDQGIAPAEASYLGIVQHVLRL